MKHIDCKRYAQELLDEVKAVPDKKTLVILTAGDNPASESYVKGKIKDCEYCGVPCEHIKVTSKDDLRWQIAQKKVDPRVGGIIIQLPLPKGWNEEAFTNLIPPHLDVDGFVHGSPFKPCTPEAIMYLLNKEVGSLAGVDVLLIGRGKLVGEPLMKMLIDADATVTVAHSKTKTLYRRLETADIVISAVGKPGLVDLLDCVAAKVVVDVGVNRDENGKLCGDCWGFNDYLYPTTRVTPVPGGIGLLTRAMLMKHMAEASKEKVVQHGSD